MVWLDFHPDSSLWHTGQRHSDYTIRKQLIQDFFRCKTPPYRLNTPMGKKDEEAETAAIQQWLRTVDKPLTQKEETELDKSSKEDSE